MGQRRLLDTVKSYHVSNYLGMILLCIGAVNFSICLKFGDRVANVVNDSRNGPLLF